MGFNGRLAGAFMAISWGTASDQGEGIEFMTLDARQREDYSDRQAGANRLISGKLSVENLGIQLPPGMAEELESGGAESAQA